MAIYLGSREEEFQRESTEDHPGREKHKSSETLEHLAAGICGEKKLERWMESTVWVLFRDGSGFHSTIEGEPLVVISRSII